MTVETVYKSGDKIRKSGLTTGHAVASVKQDRFGVIASIRTACGNEWPLRDVGPAAGQMYPPCARCGRALEMKQEAAWGGNRDE